jgi:hypothetical protein
MSRLLDRPVRPKPTYFGPDGAPPGIALRLDVYATLNDGTKWLAGRSRITPNTIVGHTNGASVEASVQSSINHGLRGTDNTKPHYCLGDKPAKTLATNLRAIANSTGASVEAEYQVRDSSHWSIAVETADLGSIAAKTQGYNWPTDCGPFLYDNADDLAHIIAYEAIVWNIPIRVPPTFPAGGVVAHTWPWPYPHFTTVPGKTCPGTTKIIAIRDEIIPRAQQIRAVWTQPTPTPDEETTMAQMRVVRLRWDGYADQVVAFHTSADTLRQVELLDDPVILLPKPDAATLAKIEAELGHKMTPV